jgi:hypothetical protein
VKEEISGDMSPLPTYLHGCHKDINIPFLLNLADFVDTMISKVFVIYSSA